ncbi:hypothetical protein DBR23_10055 [Acidovorax sp. HMWF018]|uniref:hypothetical protein n=1 Tax=Acidovorax sp. HMWF018 TaxID=2056855 RepID=UPI000D3AC660|nr:hypothetical protein [Acidovorax sp. HMWF018]PTT39841.1 hypothetical protein DBR23_10055 [Acidovorax sp. HMWF018]
MTQQQSHLSPGALLANEEPTKRDRFANGHLIWDTIIELRNSERRINRRALADLTGLKPGIVDDHVERFIEKDQLRRAGNGELEVIEQFPATRPFSKTVLPDGLVRLEIGSDMLELTPGEARVIAREFAGHLQELAQTDAANRAVVLCHELARELKDARSQIKALRALIPTPASRETPQLNLLEHQ